ncbi:MAG TPA: oligosaccharide flippase family protein [Candidatus Moranbacteria bacterium]|nr:oligosaccharide flippase family protein [Candidatus Moranbacteria bacterium]
MIQRIKNNAFARNSLILFIGTMTANVLNYVFHLVIGRMVSAEVYGEVESLVSLIAIISVPAATLTMVATKFSAANKAENDRVGSSEIMKYFNRKIFVYGLPVFIVAVAISPFIKNFLKIESVWPLILVWIMMFLSFLAAVTSGIINGWQKFKDASWMGIFSAVIKLVAAVFLVKLGFAVNGVIGGFALGALVSYALSLYFLRFIKDGEKNNKNTVSNTNFFPIKRYIIPVFIGNLAINILSNADMVLAKHNLDSISAGQYGALTVVSKVIFFATGIIGTVLFSMSAEDNHKKNNSKSTFKHAFCLMSVVSAGAIFFYLLFPEFILAMLFGDKYRDVSNYLIWFAISVTLFSFVNLVFQYLISIHKTDIAYVLLVVSVLASLAVLFVGRGIFAIISIMITAQASALILGAYYVYKNRKEAYGR